MQNIAYYFSRETFYYLLAAVFILFIGVVLAKICKTTLPKIFIKHNWQEELSNLASKTAYWAIILISSSVSILIIASRIFKVNIDFILTSSVSIGVTIAKTLLIIIVGNYLIKTAIKILRELLRVSKIQSTLHVFICSAANIFLKVLLFMIALESLNIPTASLLAALASAGLAISLSVKDHLSNLIGGVVILLSHPFKEGDFVEINGTEGLVSQIGLIYTVLKTFDNRTVMIPNNDTAKAKIVNHSSENLRRLDMTFSIGYEDNYELARELILKTAKETGLCLENPQPFARMKGHGSNSIDISCRLWTKWENYFELCALMNENVKKAFDKNHINIPFNQMDVHIINK